MSAITRLARIVSFAATYRLSIASNASGRLTDVRSAIGAWHDELEALRQLVRPWPIDMPFIDPATILTALANGCHSFCLR
jgi:hypothetical protein